MNEEYSRNMQASTTIISTWKLSMGRPSRKLELLNMVPTIKIRVPVKSRHFMITSAILFQDGFISVWFGPQQVDT